MSGNRPGRKPKLTPEVQETICRYISAGSFRETASAAAGIDSRTLRKWLKKAADDDKNGEETIHVKFRAAMDVAEAKAETRDVARITTASIDDWKAAAWILERRGRKRWCFKQQTELSGPDGKPIEVADATPAKAASLVREQFGSHAANSGDDFDPEAVNVIEVDDDD